MKSNIFIIDDDELFSDMLVNHLSSNRFLEVYRYATGEEAVQELSKDPAIVILDYHLNTIEKDAANGLEVLKRIKKTLPRANVIMLSSQTQYGVAANTIMEGAVQYVMKDDTAFEKIFDIIKDILKDKRL